MLTFSFASSDVMAEELPAVVEFNTHIRPIFNQHCVGCHGGVKQVAGLTLIYRDKALAELESGSHAIVPGNIHASALIERINEQDADLRMPPAEHGRALTEHEIALLTKWVEQGANWQQHWAYVAPQPADLPAVQQADWPRMPLDYWVLSNLERENLKPSAEADRREWLRRATFDITGLPPTIDELRAFDADQSEGAYERVSDRLLASPRFGERWASLWMDLARYADTMGYEKDPHRDIWPYRDWLIRALDADMPYDEFTIKQLAGDLLPSPSLDDRLATALHRNTQTNTEGGTDDEEFRLAAVLDRVNTTAQVWNATTMGCVQCHSHPYEPIDHDEYYKLAAIFNDTRDTDVSEDLPHLAVPTAQADFDTATKLDRQICDLECKLHSGALALASDRGLWRSLKLSHASSSGSTKLTVTATPEGDEFVTSGNITVQSMYDLRGTASEAIEQVTAVRIDALPKDLEAALKTPEMGFVLTRLRAWLVSPDGTEQEVFFARAWCDDPHPTWQPADVFEDTPTGWAAYSRLDRPRWAVFVLDKPMAWPAGAELKLQLKHERMAVGQIPLVINRGRVSVSGDARWTEFLGTREVGLDLAKLDDLRVERSTIASVNVPTMQSQGPASQREMYTFVRGNWLDKGNHVTAGTPAIFPAPEGDAPVDRMAMAKWLVSGKHPLTARVMANRLWEQMLGTGIVETTEDFGTSGSTPSNQGLLDHLALRLQNDHAWHAKPLLREILLSATYRQSSHLTPELIARDPHNCLLSHGPRKRLSAEMVRDQALAVSGLMSTKMFGPSVMPPQPDGVWRPVYSGAEWLTSEGEDRYRRAVYTYWRRTSAYPSMMSFDAPSREVCTVRRIGTNTPLQALVTLNDPVYLECATALAKRSATAGTAPADQIAFAYEAVTSEPISQQIAAELLNLYNDAAGTFDPTSTAMQSIGPSADEYAMAIVASAVLNLDQALTK